MFVLVKHPLVDCDVEEAAIWYHQRDPRVADRFIDETKRAMKLAAAEPQRFLTVFPGVRRVRLKNFPQNLYFYLTADTVYVLTVTHGARDLEKLIFNRLPSNVGD